MTSPYTKKLDSYKSKETDDQKLWLKLIEDNFVAAVSLQLQVTNLRDPLKLLG
jgi:hypothetical protein